MNDKRIEIRISRHLKNRYTAHAEERGCSLSAWAKMAMSEKAKRDNEKGVGK